MLVYVFNIDLLEFSGAILEKGLLRFVRKSLEFFCKQTRIGIIPTRKADPNIFLIALKQDYIDAQYVS